MIEIISDHKTTNADKIRGLNDEELADFIVGQRCCDANENSEKVILEWLRQPAE